MGRCACTALMALLVALPARGAEFNASLILAPEIAQPDRSSPYYVGSALVPERGSRQELELRLREGGFNAQGTLRWLTEQGRTPAGKEIINQLYYDGELGGGYAWTVGKKLMSWGVGFGFRPLDVVQREDRRSINPPALVGIPLLAMEHFSANGAWTLVWARPGEGGGDSDSRDPSLALHGYLLAGSDDLHGVARVSRRRGLEVGFGGTRVVGEAWSFHAAALYASRSWRLLNTLTKDGGTFADTDPMQESSGRPGLKAVLGAQWTGVSGWSLLAEAWYDGDAYSRTQWRQLDALTARQRALAGLLPEAFVTGNVAWSSQAYQAANLLRENLLLRAAYDNQDGFKPYGELLLTPADGGLVLTLGSVYEGNRQRFSFGLRQFGGAGNSVYGQSPFQRVAWAEWRLALF